MSNVTAVINDVALGEVVAEGALALILKIKGILGSHDPSLTVEIKNLDSDALAAYQGEFEAANAWLVAHGFKPVAG